MPMSPRAGWAAAAAAALALTLPACGSEATPAAVADGPTVSITDAQNRTVEVPVKPETVVVTDWSALRTLTDLGIEADAVPTANGALPADLARYAGDEVTKVGTLFELDYEKINELEPDLVIVGSRSGTPEVVEELTKITPAVVDLSALGDVAGLVGPWPAASACRSRRATGPSSSSARSWVGESSCSCSTTSSTWSTRPAP